MRAVAVDADFATTVERVRAELQAEGFGVLTEIDVTATMKEKLGETLEDYVILGACNPPLAYRALDADRSVGLYLPCNVVVRAKERGTLVEAFDPRLVSAVVGSAGLKAVADDAADRLERVLDRLPRVSRPTARLPRIRKA